MLISWAFELYMVGLMHKSNVVKFLELLKSIFLF